MEKIIPNTLGSFAASLAVGTLKGPLETLANVWFLKFGHKSHRERLKLESEIESEILGNSPQLLKEEILKVISEINPEYIQEPNTHIIGPAINNCDYYINDETIRNIFASLIGNAFDKSKNPLIHPAFTSIIQELSPLDAKVLSSVNNGNHAIANIHLIHEENSSFLVQATNVYSSPDLDNVPHELIASSLDNLDRLGLITITYTTHKSNDQLYDQIRDKQIYKIHKQLLEECKTHPVYAPLNKLELQKGKCSPTQFGKDFYSVCL